jgi:hypothetical protein
MEYFVNNSCRIFFCLNTLNFIYCENKVISYWCVRIRGRQITSFEYFFFLLLILFFRQNLEEKEIEGTL